MNLFQRAKIVISIETTKYKAIFLSSFGGMIFFTYLCTPKETNRIIDNEKDNDGLPRDADGMDDGNGN